LNGFQVGKYLARAGTLVIDVLVLLVVAGPILGAATPQLTPHNELGAGIDLSTLQQQVNLMFSSTSTMAAPTTVAVPAFNNWLFPSTLSLSIGFSINGSAVYQSPVSTIDLQPFHSGVLNLSVALSQDEIARLQGHSVKGGGTMSVQEGGFWKITLNLGQS
jgi:hypothetical protein